MKPRKAARHPKQQRPDPRSTCDKPERPVPPPAGSLPWRDVALVFLAALAIRLVYALLASRTNPFFAFTIKGFDQFTYQQQALAILKGDWLLRQQGLFYYSPVYSYFAALVYALFGPSNFWALHLLQAAIGALTGALCFVLAGTWLSRRAAWVAVALWILAAPVLFYEQELLHEGLMLLFYATLLWGLRTAQLGRRATGARLLLAGTACVLAMVGRGNALALLLTLPFWILFAMPRPGAAASRLARLGWTRAALFILGALLVLVPLLARNHAVSGRWTLGMANGRVLFYLGNCADANGEFAYSPRFQAAQNQAAQDPAVYGRAFLEDLHQAPGHILGNLLHKTYLFIGARDLPDNLNFQLCRRLITPLHWTPVQWDWLVPLGLVGLLLSFFYRKGWSLLWVFTAVFAASIILIVPVGRYRLPVLIPLALWAGLAAEWFLVQFAARRMARVALAGAAFLFLALALFPWNAPPMRPNEFFSFTHAAIAQKMYPLAHRVLDIGLEIYPGEPRILGRALDLAQAEGNRAEARRLADTLWDLRMLDEKMALQLADIFAHDGRLDRARALLEGILQSAPNNLDARQRLEALNQSSR